MKHTVERSVSGTSRNAVGVWSFSSRRASGAASSERSLSGHQGVHACSGGDEAGDRVGERDGGARADEPTAQDAEQNGSVHGVAAAGCGGAGHGADEGLVHGGEEPETDRREHDGGLDELGGGGHGPVDGDDVEGHPAKERSTPNEHPNRQSGTTYEPGDERAEGMGADERAGGVGDVVPAHGEAGQCSDDDQRTSATRPQPMALVTAGRPVQRPTGPDRQSKLQGRPTGRLLRCAPMGRGRGPG